MSTTNDVKQLKSCLIKIIDLVKECLQKLKSTTEQPQSNAKDENLLHNSQLNNNVYTFTLNNKENEILDNLTTDIQSILNQHLPHLSKIGLNYLLDFLHLYHYDREQREFASPLAMGVLHSFHRELEGLLDSVEAYPAALNGQLDIVRRFLKQHPTYKDKPGPWETTLLYSAAKNNHLDIVKYLIEVAHCSVNAQNQRDVGFALNTCGADFTPKTSAASTALHAACFNNHLRVVKYLVEHNADYFIHNQGNETPIMNGEQFFDINEYFQEYLIIRYSIVPPKRLPDRSIMNDNRRPLRDCMWEYKPFQDPKWYQFTANEANTLHKALLPSEEFQQEIHLKVEKGLYSVSMIEFYRSGKHEQDPQKNMAWIRCRGSSILNFDCYSIWQIMLIQHHKINKAGTISSFQIKHFPTMSDSRFKLQLNTWYSCDTKTSSVLDDSMNYRRKIVSIDIPFVDNDLTFNLQTFEFSNNGKTILGYVRWIPKLISNTNNHDKRIVPIDNYQPMANIQPIPMTTKRSKEVSPMKKADQHQTDDLVNTEEDDDSDLPIESALAMGDDDDFDNDGIDHSNKKNRTTADNTGTWSITDLNDEITAVNSPSVVTTTTNTTVQEDSNLSIEDFFHEKPDQPTFTERTNSAVKDDTSMIRTWVLEAEIQDLKDKIEYEQLKVEAYQKSAKKLTTEKEQELQDTKTLLKDLQQQLLSTQAREQKWEDFAKKIKSIDYKNVESIIANDFLFGRLTQIVHHLKTKYIIDDSFVGIPNITMQEENDMYCITVTGIQAHHDEFKLILRRIQTLSNAIQSAKAYYQRQLNATLRSINQIMKQQIHSSQNWKSYIKYLQEIIKNKIDESVKLFDEYISQKSKEMTEQCITDPDFQSRIHVRKLTSSYMETKQFEHELEQLKHEALEEFIKQHVLSERAKFEKKPSSKSLQTLNEYIDKVKKDFQTNKIYVGWKFEQLKEIPKLLERIMLYYRCFLLQLPLYETSQELLEKIENNTVITISTSTGSGKSTLLPALLIAEGYEKVIVTQPRRLPCTSICKRVNETMTTHKNDMKLAGWAVSGAECDVKARILYLTDGLLKERLLHDENLITNQTKTTKPFIFFIDEVHERSINIDLCLALIARLLTEKPHLKSQVKIIISSATLDSSVPTLFHQIPHIKVDEFKMPMLGTLYRVDPFARPNENILDLVQELCRKRQRDDQILCFVSSTSEVNQCCQLLKEISNGTIIAYPLIQAQSASDQQRYIEEGSIFFSTTVAETSLTFPSLTYVIDTGFINMPIYDFGKKQTTLQEIRAAESTIKQRRGRLGRTKPGEYYSLYDFKVEEKKYPTPQICQSELVNVEFSLRKSAIQNGLNYMTKFLPNPPSPQAINAATEELKRLRIVDASDKLTSIGVSISKLPDFGSLAMSKSVLSALNQNNCGRDLVVLSSILGVLNTSSILKSIPSSMKSPDGDFMTLLNVMNEILLVRESVRPAPFILAKICQAKNLMSIFHVLKQALRRYESLEKSFNLSNEYRAKAQVSSNDWKLIAKSLLDGYGENVFVSMKELQGKTHLFTRYAPPTEDSAVLDLQSTLTQAVTAVPVALVLARDIRFSSSIRATAVLSFVGKIKSQWIDYPFKRIITLNSDEETKLNADNIIANAKQTFSDVQIQLNNYTLTLQGPAGSVLDAELDILRRLVVEMKFTLTNPYSPNATADYKRMKQNLESVSKMIDIFKPMIWRWETQRQVKITVNNTTIKDQCEITIEGRDSQNQLVYKEFQSFLGWLKGCAVIRRPNAGVSPQIVKPQIRKDCLDIEEKISHITDSKRTSIELWKSLKGSKATRETRMEVVAWIAVCIFDCRLEGGFIRDWVVGNYTFHPNGPSSTWLSYGMNNVDTPIPRIEKEVIPSDLDFHLPSRKYFDIDKFLDKLHKYQFECQVFREDWRYILLLDENTKTGPFTVDLIEPHVALTHDRIDFDVSNLSLEKDYTKELGMRVDIQQKPYSIELEKIVSNIKNKRFQVLRPIDKDVQPRIDKMESRKWRQIGQPMSVIPNPPPKYQVVLAPLPESTELYKSLVQQMRSFISNQVQVLSIEQIKNPLLEEAYFSNKQIIAEQCPGQNPNERELFHGTKGEAIDGILNDGFDDRYWGTNVGMGKFGHGAYFADNPGLSHKYAEPDPGDNTCVMYYNKVTLGKECILQENNEELMSAPIGYHSVHGKFLDSPNSDEYIVYRYGQALPYLKIIYTA